MAQTVPESPRAVSYALPWGTLRGLAWGDSGLPILLAVHGWLDNAASFNQLAPELAREYQVVAIDLPGHGVSDHRPEGETYEMLDHVRDLAVLITRHMPRGVTVVGHSLGGILGSLLAAACPELVKRLVMIDSLGPVTARAEEFPAQLGKALQRITQGSRADAPIYESVDEAIEARLGGRIPLSRLAAGHIVPRNLHQTGKRWSWRTDSRLRYPSMHRLEESEVLAALAAIRCPTLVLKASRGMLDYLGDSLNERYAALSRSRVLEVEGGHHLHLDGDVQRLADSVKAWLEHD